jgi:Holliday junction DNA helicase RuvB
MADPVAWLVGLIGGWFSVQDDKEVDVEISPISLVHSSAKHRPQSFEEFVGNRQVVERLSLAVRAARKESRALPHVMLYGQPGLGKTTLAYIIANEMGAALKEVTGSTIRNQTDLYKLLLDIDFMADTQPTVLMIDECADITKAQNLPETVWFPLLEDFQFFHSLKSKSFVYKDKLWSVVDDKAIMRPFTVIGATTDPGQLTDAFRDRFPITAVLYPYKLEDLAKIIEYHAKKRGFKVENDAIIELSKRVRGNARTAVNYLLACRDRAVVEEAGMTKALVERQMQLQGVDEEGLMLDDVRVLMALHQNPRGLGLANLAGTANMRKTTITEIVEPFLKQKGYMAVTSRRVITDAGVECLRRKGLIDSES